MEQKNNKVAVIGTGHWGKNLVRNFFGLGVLKTICDKNECVLSKFQSEYEGIQICLALNEILSDSDIHAMAVATPAETHYAIGREALLAGKHVFIEKPLTLDETEAKDLINIAERKKRILMVGHLMQYHPIFVTLKELASTGELGRINYIYSHRLNLGRIRREENILWSFAPHDISMILSLAGETAENVTAVGGNYLHKKIADVTTTHLTFPSGLKAHIFVSWLHPFKEQKLVVVGDKKMAVFDDNCPWEDKLLLFPHQITWKDHYPVPQKAEPERVDVYREEPLKLECLHFLECIEFGKTPITDGYEGLRVLKVLKMAQAALDIPESFKKELEPRPGVITEPPSRPKNIFVHETAVIDDRAEIGEGTKIWHFSHILTGSKIGPACNIGQNVVIGPDVSIGMGCKIQNNVSVYKGVTLEDHVFCGPSMVFTNIRNPRAHINKMDQVRPTLIKKGSTLGANCTIVCGITVGKYALIGAGALVNKNVQDHALVVGNPANRIAWVCKCGERLTDSLFCRDCGKTYERTLAGIAEKKFGHEYHSKAQS